MNNSIEHDQLFVTFKLDGGEVDAEGFRRYRPGELLKGLVEVEAREDIRSRSVTLEFGWHTEGKGSRNSEVVDRKSLASGSLRARQSVGDQFVFEVPRSPWSFAGHFITIIWALTVKVDVPMGRDIAVSQPFIVDPGE